MIQKVRLSVIFYRHDLVSCSVLSLDILTVSQLSLFSFINRYPAYPADTVVF